MLVVVVGLCLLALKGCLKLPSVSFTKWTVGYFSYPMNCDFFLKISYLRESFINWTGVWEVHQLPGSGKYIKYRGPFSFDLAFTRCRLTSPVFGRCVTEHCNFRNLHNLVNISTLQKSKREGPTGNPTPPALYEAWDRKLIWMLTGAMSHCGPQSSGTSPVLG